MAHSVYASVWKQTCLSISNLSQSTMCVTFGVPLVPLKAVEDKTVEECLTEMKENSHIFQLQGDFVSRLLRFDDITNGVKDHDKVSHLFLYGMFYCYSNSCLEKLVQLLLMICLSIKKQGNRIRYTIEHFSYSMCYTN